MSAKSMVQMVQQSSWLTRIYAQSHPIGLQAHDDCAGHNAQCLAQCQDLTLTVAEDHERKSRVMKKKDHWKLS